ncbi:Bgt-4777 [Blumeria graminis f. sp. tritici]|uniref:Bgt-4777 n=1 Tax=Blumeria graminis f. sp. tritici TaxID=62690 RepID=A0A9X9MFR2_BLUGR|nr:Bgt-4777 [Blumeria graminis f. sp. tritici]
MVKQQPVSTSLGNRQQHHRPSKKSYGKITASLQYPKEGPNCSATDDAPNSFEVRRPLVEPFATTDNLPRTRISTKMKKANVFWSRSRFNKNGTTDVETEGNSKFSPTFPKAGFKRRPRQKQLINPGVSNAVPEIHDGTCRTNNSWSMRKNQVVQQVACGLPFKQNSENNESIEPAPYRKRSGFKSFSQSALDINRRHTTFRHQDTTKKVTFVEDDHRQMSVPAHRSLNQAAVRDSRHLEGRDVYRGAHTPNITKQSSQPQRTETPTDLDYRPIGAYKHGSLRIMNGTASPAIGTDRELDEDCSSSHNQNDRLHNLNKHKIPTHMLGSNENLRPASRAINQVRGSSLEYLTLDIHNTNLDFDVEMFSASGGQGAHNSNVSETVRSCNDLPRRTTRQKLSLASQRENKVPETPSRPPTTKDRQFQGELLCSRAHGSIPDSWDKEVSNIPSLVEDILSHTMCSVNADSGYSSNDSLRSCRNNVTSKMGEDDTPARHLSSSPFSFVSTSIGENISPKHRGEINKTNIKSPRHGNDTNPVLEIKFREVSFSASSKKSLSAEIVTENFCTADGQSHNSFGLDYSIRPLSVINKGQGIRNVEFSIPKPPQRKSTTKVQRRAKERSSTNFLDGSPKKASRSSRLSQLNKKEKDQVNPSIENHDDCKRSIFNFCTEISTSSLENLENLEPPDHSIKPIVVLKEDEEENKMQSNYHRSQPDTPIQELGNMAISQNILIGSETRDITAHNLRLSGTPVTASPINQSKLAHDFYKSDGEDQRRIKADETTEQKDQQVHYIAINQLKQPDSSFDHNSFKFQNSTDSEDQTVNKSAPLQLRQNVTSDVTDEVCSKPSCEKEVQTEEVYELFNSEVTTHLEQCVTGGLKRREDQSMLTKKGRVEQSGPRRTVPTLVAEFQARGTSQSSTHPTTKKCVSFVCAEPINSKEDNTTKIETATSNNFSSKSLKAPIQKTNLPNDSIPQVLNHFSEKSFITVSASDLAESSGLCSKSPQELTSTKSEILAIGLDKASSETNNRGEVPSRENKQPQTLINDSSFGKTITTVISTPVPVGSSESGHITPKRYRRKLQSSKTLAENSSQTPQTILCKDSGKQLAEKNFRSQITRKLISEANNSPNSDLETCVSSPKELTAIPPKSPLHDSLLSAHGSQRQEWRKNSSNFHKTSRSPESRDRVCDQPVRENITDMSANFKTRDRFNKNEPVSQIGSLVPQGLDPQQKNSRVPSPRQSRRSHPPQVHANKRRQNWMFTQPPPLAPKVQNFYSYIESTQKQKQIEESLKMQSTSMPSTPIQAKMINESNDISTFRNILRKCKSAYFSEDNSTCEQKINLLSPNLPSQQSQMQEECLAGPVEIQTTNKIKRQPSRRNSDLGPQDLNTRPKWDSNEKILSDQLQNHCVIKSEPLDRLSTAIIGRIEPITKCHSKHKIASMNANLVNDKVQVPTSPPSYYDEMKFRSDGEIIVSEPSCESTKLTPEKLNLYLEAEILDNILQSPDSRSEFNCPSSIDTLPSQRKSMCGKSPRGDAPPLPYRSLLRKSHSSNFVVGLKSTEDHGSPPLYSPDSDGILSVGKRVETQEFPSASLASRIEQRNTAIESYKNSAHELQTSPYELAAHPLSTTPIVHSNINNSKNSSTPTKTPEKSPYQSQSPSLTYNRLSSINSLPSQIRDSRLVSPRASIPPLNFESKDTSDTLSKKEISFSSKENCRSTTSYSSRNDWIDSSDPDKPQGSKNLADPDSRSSLSITTNFPTIPKSISTYHQSLSPLPSTFHTYSSSTATSLYQKSSGIPTTPSVLMSPVSSISNEEERDILVLTAGWRKCAALPYRMQNNIEK